jgi:GABA(A) receptor-associated protein
MKFKSEYTLSERISIYENLNERYPNKIPIIIEFDCSFNGIERKKYLFDPLATGYEFISKIRKEVKIPSNKAIFIFTDDNSINISLQSIYEVYNDYLFNNRHVHGGDKILYLNARCENTYG